ncbi:polysaccharide deacetylase [Clostridium guangxiense]|uniref:polysaccharide deacetylase family protein n=1 Tax=Clostridium sp. DMHC 10 TaxID=747377 RepID=UPI000B045B65|nr:MULTISPECIES: polysaccharide deacetylase family protein [Clostridium]MCD2345432.1 polysaccharide deacetylase [Clostridium guangxiense]
MKNKKGIIFIVLTCFIAVGCWKAFFQFGRYYSEKSKVDAEVKNVQVKKVVKKENKTNVRSGMEVFKVNSEPGEFEPWRLEKDSKKKIVYLTIDDGPSYNTRKILDILRENNINATFFLIGQNAERYPQFVRQEVEEGNSIANHTYSHPLRYRGSAQGFIDDVNKCDRILRNIVGDKYISKFMRFPGGAFESEKRLEPYRDAVKQNGYRFLNWNAMTGDADRNLEPVEYLINHVKNDVRGEKIVVLLMHDAPAKTTTVQALPTIIQYLKSQGYTFGVFK